MHAKPHGAGKSSFDLIDRDKLFAELALKKDTVLMDLGCGEGNYTMAAASCIESEGHVYALDLWAEGIQRLRQKTERKNHAYITAEVVDAGVELPVDSGAIDICLLGTVFHDFVHGGIHESALREIHRVLAAGGLLAVVEFMKKDGPPGPPQGIRLSPEELQGMITPAGFQDIRSVEVGPHTYLSIFSRWDDT